MSTIEEMKAERKNLEETIANMLIDFEQKYQVCTKVIGFEYLVCGNILARTSPLKIEVKV